jgi:hypothetical protein
MIPLLHDRTSFDLRVRFVHHYQLPPDLERIYTLRCCSYAIAFTYQSPAALIPSESTDSANDRSRNICEVPESAVKTMF